MSTPQPRKPTADFVQKQIDEVRRNRQFAREREVLSKILERFPLNRNLEDVILKTSLVNSIYSTRIFDVCKVGYHIVDQQIDSQLESKSPEVVERIARVTFDDGKKKYLYSFATKYCSWHKPNDYPRYDGYVSRLLISYQKRDDFDQFVSDDLKNYVRYKEIIGRFRDRYQLTQFNFDELDQFLWAYGKAYEKELETKTRPKVRKPNAKLTR
jgi:hypothetical protein